MARCKSCSAPLLANINRCQYCSVRNDIDLHSKHKFSIKTKHSDRICPHCDTPLQTIKLDIKGAFHIERCKTCFGLFFDTGEIETLLESSVSNISNINLSLIKNINKDRFQSQQQIKYIKCPVCSSFMKRVNFGHRSGVIIDQCPAHGIWVDSGEITHLMEWKKAGGELLDIQEKTKHNPKKSNSIGSFRQPEQFQQYNNLEPDLLESVSSLIYKIFT